MSSILRPVKLGIFFDQVIHAGGGYQQALNAAILANKLPKNLVEIIFFTQCSSNIKTLHVHGIDAVLIRLNILNKIFLEIRRFISHPRLMGLWKKLIGLNKFEKIFVQNRVDLVYFLAPCELAVHLEELNYITTLWDLCHRDDLEFPEVRAGRIFENREIQYRNILPKAVAILVESPLGKINVTRRYGIDDKRVHVMPLTAAIATQITDEAYQAAYIDIHQKYQLNFPYVFYPAQFWAHKNHVYLLEGLKCLEEYFGHKVGAVFSGGDKGNLNHVRNITAQLGLSDRVRFVGFVSNDEIPYLYKQSLALVMPTYFGPTNLPPLEAFSLGVPVLYSDKPGLSDQVENAALLMDLNDPMTMARHLVLLINNPKLSAELVVNGKAILERYTDEHRLKTLSSIIYEFQRRRASWI